MAPPACYSVTFVKPVDLQQLSAADDKDADDCANGFQFDVLINTSAPNGTDVQLYAGAVLLKTVQASGGQASFTNVQFSAAGDTNLSIQFPSTMACTAATTKAKVTVDCSVPTCSITAPVISATHPALNGVPSSQGGDRVSASGSPYEAAFVVTTDIADNQSVALDINDATTPAIVTTVTARASGGTADFAGVALPPGATYQIQARCIAANGVVGRSAKGSYPVDATAPDLTVSRPQSGDFIGPGGLNMGKFQVCGKTTASDAVNLDPALGTRVSNYCVQTGGSPVCKPVTAVGVDTCVDITCPGDAPFNINVSLTDAAGNPGTQVISGVTCSSNNPTVQIISPVTDAPLFNDPARHLLAATAAQPFRDQNAGVAGAQTDVVACSSRAGTAKLFAGLANAALTQVGGSVTTVAATALDGCPSGLGFVARFPGVTLPESAEMPNGTLATATQIRVDVTDVSAATGLSGALDLWVDSTAPTLSLTSPVGLCGSFHQAFATFDTDLIFATNTSDVTATIANGGTQTLMPTTFASNVATFSMVSFNLGQSDLAAVARDPAGNSTAMLPIPCTVTAGMAPVVVFAAPTSANSLCPAGAVVPGCIPDGDTNQTGWQGSLSVNALLSGLPITSGNITFSAGGAPLGVAPLDASGNATLTGVTLFDGLVTITAQTDNIPGHGVGTGTLTIVVDLGAPDLPTNLMATVLDRRETSFQLTWTAPGDQGQRVTGYQVRYAKVPITAANFDTVASPMSYTGTPSAPGAADGIAVGPLNIETDYYFAIASVDAAGTRSAVVATSTPVKATFNVTILSGTTATDNAGFDLNGAGDFGTSGTRSFAGDGFSDLLVGSTGATHAYAYFGSATGYSTTPSITFTGAVSGFGRSVADIGDIDGDGLADIAISSPNDSGGRVYIYSRKNPPASWGPAPITTWPADLADTQANYIISTPASVTGVITGRGVNALGDFDGVAPDDFAISYQVANGVGAVIVVKGSSSFSSRTPDTTNSIQINGTAAGGIFGAAVAGIGQFYGSAPGTTLIATASIAGTSYAFAGQSPPGGVLAVTSADDSTVGSGTDRYGTPIGFLGPLGPSPGAFTLAALTGKYVDVHLGTVATGPFLGTTGGAPAPSVRFVDTFSGNSFGVINIGGGVRGTSQSVSFVGGDALPDLIIAGQGEANNALYLVNGTALTTLTGTVDVFVALPGNVPGIIRVPGKLPADWGNGYTTGCVIVDADGDQHGDFAIGEFVSGKPGRIAVFY